MKPLTPPKLEGLHPDGGMRSGVLSSFCSLLAVLSNFDYLLELRSSYYVVILLSIYLVYSMT